jgi:glycosyltransferase involved in cell wall biosynthesis
MRLLVIDGSDFESFPPGGSKYYIRNFLRFLDRAVDVSLAGITTDRNLLGRGWIRTTVVGRECAFYAFAWVPRLAEGEKPATPIRMRAFLGLLRRVRRVLLPGFDVAYVHFPELAFPLLYPSKRLPVVFHLHGVVDGAVPLSRYSWLRNRLVARIFREINRLVIERADRVMVVSEEGRELCHALAPRSASRTAIVPPSVDRGVFRPRDRRRCRLELGIDDTADVIVSVGRLEYGKGMDLLLEALALVEKKRGNVRLVVAGEGSMRRWLERRAADLGVGGRVRFLGEVDHERTLPVVLGAADVFVLASRSEGLPTVILEAMSCGIPVVSTAVGDIPKVVQDGRTGFLVRNRGPADLAAAVVQAISARDALSPSCQMVAEKYSADCVTAVILSHLVDAAQEACRGGRWWHCWKKR